MPDAADEELRATYSACEAELVAYGHIHVPFVRRVGQLAVANSGSVGSPYDGDPRASYLLVEDARVDIVRVDYDVEQEVALLGASDYPGREEIARMRRTGRYVAPST
jgi:predicted phosphodiesterase